MDKKVQKQYLCDLRVRNDLTSNKTNSIEKNEKSELLQLRFYFDSKCNKEQ